MALFYNKNRFGENCPKGTQCQTNSVTVPCGSQNADEFFDSVVGAFRKSFSESAFFWKLSAQVPSRIGGKDSVCYIAIK
jgi:hypothetical protein